MIKNILCGMGGISLYGVVSISIFFIFFTGMLVWAFGLKKHHLNTMSNLPLDSGEQPDKSTDQLQS